MLLYLYLVIFLIVTVTLLLSSFSKNPGGFLGTRIPIVIVLAIVITNVIILVGLELWQTETVKEINDHGDLEMYLLIATGLAALIAAFAW